MINITYIYLVENCFNDPNKVYIGKTKNPRNRKWDHQKTYGKNIEYTIIDQVDSLEHKVWKPIETMWIQSFMIWGFDVVNLRKEGGNGSSEWSEESKRKQSDILKNRPNTWTTEEVGNKISQGLKKFYENPENKKKISQGLKQYYENNPSTERPKILEKNKVKEIREKYQNGQRICDLSREYNVSWGTIKNVVEKRESYKK
jgi:hypothetical protein